MRYGELISRSIDIAWRHRYLWLLGALGGGEAAGGGYASLGNIGNGGSAFNGGGSGAGIPDQVSSWFASALPLLILLGALLVVFFLAYFLVSCVATGALVRATAEHDAERPFGLRPAWQAGMGTFLPILGLRLLVLVLTLVAVGIIAAIVAAGIISALNDQVGAAAVAFVLAGMAVLVLVVVGIAFGITVTLAIRAIVLEGRGVVAAIGRGFELLQHRIGRVLLVWLLSIVAGLAVGVIVGVGVVLVAIPFAVVALAAYGLAGLGGLLTAGAVLLTVFTLAVTLVSGAAGSYLSVYWTLAFRRLEVDATAAPAPPYPLIP